MNQQNALEKNKRCPKGFVRNKEGVCVPKVAKPTEIVDDAAPTKLPKEKVPKVPKEKVPKVPKEKVSKVPKEKVPKVPKEKVPKVPKETVTTHTVNKSKKVSPKAKTMKKMTKTQAAKLLAERRECLQNFHNNLTIID